jgi:hypothetical protein
MDRIGISLGQWALAEAAGSRAPTPASQSLLTQFFTNIVYPLLVLAVLVTTFWIIKTLIQRARDTYERVRLVASAALPLVILTFIRVTNPSPGGMISTSANKPMLALFGGLTGLLLLELGRILVRSNGYLAMPVCTFFLSALAVFILDSAIGSGIHRLDYFIFAFVIVVILDVVIRDLPRTSVGSRSRPRPAADTQRPSADLSGAPLT